MEVVDVEPTKGVDYEMDPRLEDDEQRTTPVEELIEVPIDDYQPERQVKVGSGLGVEARNTLVEVLKRNRDVFAWTHDDMVGIDPDVMCHRLNIDPEKQPKRQRR